MSKNIKSPSNKIYIGSKALWQLNQYIKKSAYKQFLIICDENTIKHCLPLLISNCPTLHQAHVFEIEAGEGSKSIEIATQIWQTWLESKAGKDSLIINLGGGVVTDLGGFCASVFKRGLEFINVPTSLLAMVDASIGGKTAIDFLGVKNAIGTFYEPKAVFIDPLFLITLPKREVKNGLAEIVKMALIADKKLWSILQNPETTIDDALIQNAIQIKNKIVIKDPKDMGVRKALNYGHSIGHAIEAQKVNSKNSILHGEAIVIGMIIENHIAFQKKLLKKEVMDLINHFLSTHFKPIPLSLAVSSELILLIDNDKKNKNNKWQFSLLTAIGNCKINLEVKANEVKKAFQYYSKLIG